MIYSVTAENEAGEQLEMRLSCPQFSGMNIYNIEGLGTPKADINTVETPNINGSIFNMARARNRNIVFRIKYVDSDFQGAPVCASPPPRPICVDSYNDLLDKPQINHIELIGDQSGEELGLQNEMEPIANTRIAKLLDKYWGGGTDK